MGIKVDSRLTQTENLNKLLEDAGIGADRRRDFESISILEEDNTVNGESYNTQIQMHLIHGSQTHRKEKKTFASSVYNRMPTGWNNDRGYVFNYDETVRKPLNRDKKAEDLKNLAAMVNESDKLSQDTKYPFRVNVNEAYTEIEIIPHLASPCYYGKKKYPLKVKIDKANEPIFEPEIYVVSALGIPGASLVNSDLKQTTRLSLTTNDSGFEYTHDIDALVIPYKQRIDEVLYTTPIARNDGSFYLRDPDGQVADLKTTLLGIGKPYKDQEFSDIKKENLTRLVTNNSLEDILSVSTLGLAYTRISNVTTQLIIDKNRKKYKINILKLKLSEVIYTILSNHINDDVLTREGDRFVLTTDNYYRTDQPRSTSLEKIAFRIERNNTSDNELVFVLEDQALLPRISQNNDIRRHRLFNYGKVNHFMRMIRNVIANDLISYGFNRLTADSLLGGSFIADSTTLFPYKQEWKTTEDSFIVIGREQSYYPGQVPLTAKYIADEKLAVTEYPYPIEYPSDDYIDYRMRITFKRT